jgi:hypothetical protein
VKKTPIEQSKDRYIIYRWFIPVACELQYLNWLGGQVKLCFDLPTLSIEIQIHKINQATYFYTANVGNTDTAFSVTGSEWQFSARINFLQLVLTICTIKFNIQKFYVPTTQRIYEFCMVHRANGDYSPGTATRLREVWGSNPGRGKNCLSSPKSPDWLWGLPYYK